jgi:hypothetical protein
LLVPAIDGVANGWPMAMAPTLPPCAAAIAAAAQSEAAQAA